MGLEQIFDNASSVMTVVSFTTFLGILLWTFVLNRRGDFDAQASLPFADEEDSRG
ncbi:cbb3-type cytochrome oxidase subunit 3 [Massilia cavernae]|uniref:CcoQ/FixQ family Cbb3-type cytochrome c oxidase assembly chaperone n=1 Tax=Massilia cavernae TaxID=2320864 RepID=A0A418XR44_9BURK|nr:cbb3-type cytochrome c oxidase subunit 3 [Massilia cavernae]RJG14949.1 CcoQ/FixQ family Cbb3-type cytochrome c oxidase assembly chaperone [Massilia cavernae]